MCIEEISRKVLTPERELRYHLAALEREMKYHRDAVKECREVIAQMHRGYALPGEPTYIHPADMAEILQKIDYMDVFQFPGPLSSDTTFSDLIQVKGTRYKQSPFMPQITTKF